MHLVKVWKSVWLFIIMPQAVIHTEEKRFPSFSQIIFQTAHFLLLLLFVYIMQSFQPNVTSILENLAKSIINNILQLECKKKKNQ